MNQKYVDNTITKYKTVPRTSIAQKGTKVQKNNIEQKMINSENQTIEIH